MLKEDPYVRLGIGKAEGVKSKNESSGGVAGCKIERQGKGLLLACLLDYTPLPACQPALVIRFLALIRARTFRNAVRRNHPLWGTCNARV